MSLVRGISRLICCGVLLGGLSTSASAQVTYSFSSYLEGYSGAGDGFWTGSVTFDWLTSGGSGTGAASSFVTTSVPSGIATPSQGWDAVAWTVIGANSFTVTNGIVTAFQFGAQSKPDDFVVCANSGAQFSLDPGSTICPAQYNRVGVLGLERSQNFGGLQGISFTEQTANVPEPSSALLMITAAAGLIFMMRRRSGVAA